MEKEPLLSDFRIRTDKSELNIDATCCPSILKSLIFTFDSVGNEKLIVVDGLKGFG